MTRISSRPDSTLSELAPEALYSPSEKEKQLKAAYWSRVEETPLSDPAEASYQDIRAVLQTDSLQKCWGQPGFKEWFFNTSEHRERLEYLFGKALDAAEEILGNTDPKAQSARVNVIKAISELANKLPHKGPDPSKAKADRLLGAIGTMDKAELKLLLQKNGINLSISAEKPETIDLPAKQE